MEPICDLHIHSTYSDGTLSPEELICLAQKRGIGAVALCDHNTVSGLPAFVEAAAGRGVEAVPGIEFSTDYGQTELHILGLFIKPQDYPAVTEKLKETLRRKEQSNLKLVAALRAAGVELDYDSIKAGTPGGQVNRAVIAADMVRRGYCTSIKEAFSKWLSPQCGYFCPPRRLESLDVIRFIKSIGAVAVLAHPFLNLDEQGLRRFLLEAVPAGLDAMEVYYPTFSEAQTTLAGKIVDEFGLLPSGGSDFHGANKPDIALGTGKNNLHIPLGVLKKLAARVIS